MRAFNRASLLTIIFSRSSLFFLHQFMQHIQHSVRCISMNDWILMRVYNININVYIYCIMCVTIIGWLFLIYLHIVFKALAHAYSIVLRFYVFEKHWIRKRTHQYTHTHTNTLAHAQLTPKKRHRPKQRTPFHTLLRLKSLNAHK